MVKPFMQKISNDFANMHLGSFCKQAQANLQIRRSWTFYGGGVCSSDLLRPSAQLLKFQSWSFLPELLKVAKLTAKSKW